MKRVVVRLGEHDTTTTEDGPHKDVLINYIDKHEDYNETWRINDIAIIHLWQDVSFTGAVEVFFFLSKLMAII